MTYGESECTICQEPAQVELSGESLCYSCAGNATIAGRGLSAEQARVEREMARR